MKALVLIILLSISSASESFAQTNDSEALQSPSMDDLKVHKDLAEPYELMGGGIDVQIVQMDGGVHVALPDYRKLDPIIFGNAEHPRGVEGTTVITSVPVKVRDTQNGRFTKLNVLSPFGNKMMEMQTGRLNINASDITATDASTTKDKVDLMTSWQDKNGNIYTVKCCEHLTPHRAEFPTFGGVATNTILHGFSGVGTPLMPSLYAYFAFWGVGSLSKNDEGKNIFIHI